MYSRLWKIFGLVALLLLPLAASFLFLAPVASTTPLSISKTNSIFFAGYQISTVTSDKITLIQGSFAVPTISCAATPTGLDDIFYIVGIQGDVGGVTIGCNSGVAFYNYHCEFMSVETCPGISLSDTVSPGDKMSVMVTEAYSVHQDTLTLRDLTKSWSYVHTASETNSLSTASWVVIGGPIACLCGLPNFGTLKTSGNFATIGGKHGTIKSFSSTAMVTVFEDTLVDANSHIIASPNSLSRIGSAFSIKWIAAT
jgi:hypothetical protein